MKVRTYTHRRESMTTTKITQLSRAHSDAALGRLDHIAHSLAVSAEILAKTKQGDPESARIIAPLIASSLFSLVTEIEQAIADLSPNTSPF